MRDDDWKKKSRERYEALKKAGKSFFPYSVCKDIVVALLIFVAIVALATKFGAPLEGVADPTDTTYNPRPEWYFLFLFQFLKLFPGSLEPIAAIVIPGIGVLMLLLLPFWDRSHCRHPFKRPLVVGGACGVLAAICVLTVQGAQSPLLNPVENKDPQVVAGKQLFEELHCAYCHSIKGMGGEVGPDLSTVGSRRDRQWLTAHFKQPKKITPGSRMPSFDLLPGVMTQIVAYLQSLGGEGPFTEHAPVMFAEHCAGCHTLDGQGGNVGPDLSAIRTYRNKAYIMGYIKNPTNANPSATMPNFHSTLSDTDIEDLARYLVSSQRQTQKK